MVCWRDWVKNLQELEPLRNPRLLWIRACLGGLMGLAIIQICFTYLQEDLAEQKLRVFKSLIRDAAEVANPYLLSQRIEDIERQRIVKCTRLKRSGESVYFLDLSFKTNCDSVFFGFRLPLRGKHIATEIEGIDGSKWDLDFYSVNSEFFTLSLWLARLANIALFAMGYFFKRKLYRSREKLEKAEDEAARALYQVSQQVAHDIRSPLAALDSVLGDISQLPEDKRIIIRSSVTRIKDIANALLQRSLKQQVSTSDGGAKVQGREARSPQLLSAILEGLMTEKRLQFRSKMGVEVFLKIQSSAYGLFASVSAVEFKRMISNLINNSVEVLGNKGKVVCQLSEANDKVVIQIRDNGKGIPPEILPKLMQRGETHGKRGGSGLGLYHAKTTAESWEGSLELVSTLGFGTTVTLTLPRSNPPAWFVEGVQISEGGTIVVIDDDQSIHSVWQSRFDSMKLSEHGIQMLHFAAPDEVEQWVRGQERKCAEIVYLCDYEFLGFKVNGLQLIERLGIEKEAILVSSRYEETHVRCEAERLGVGLIPKGIAAYVPLTVRRPLSLLDAVLLDDDQLIISTWKAIAKQNQKALASFCEPSSFFAALTGINRRTPVFIDSNLKDGVKGEELVGKIRQLGFGTIYLATGYQPDDFAHVKGLTAVVGKEPPAAIGGEGT